MSDFDSNPEGEITEKAAITLPALDFDLEQVSLPAPEQKFSIEVIDRNHLPDLRTLKQLHKSFNRIYTSGYQFDELEDRKEYLDCHARGDWISLIVKDEQGVPVGHASVIRKSDNVAEFGRLFIDPSAQGYGLGQVLTDAQMSIAEELALAGQLDVVVAEPVTSHQASQRLYDAYNPVTSGYFDRRYTDFYSQGYRESVVRLTILFTDTVQEKREVFLPQGLQTIARQVYGELGCDREIVGVSAATRDRTRSDTLSVNDIDFDAFGVVSLEPGSARSPLTVVSDAGCAFSRGADYVEVRIDVGHSDAIEQINALRLAGFYFAALEANPSTDVLVLQRLAAGYDQEISPHVSNFYSKNAEQLVESLSGTRWNP